MSSQPPPPPRDPDEPSGSEEWPSAPGGGSRSEPPSGPPPSGPPPSSPPPAAGAPGSSPAPTGGDFSVAAAFTYGWEKFQQNMGPIILGTMVYLGASIVIGVIWFFLAGAILGVGGDSGAGFFAFMLTTAVMGLVGVALFFIIQAGIIRAALALTSGRQIEMKTLLDLDNVGQVILTALIVGVASAIGFVLCYIPGLVVMVFTSFAMHFVIDQRMQAVDAIKASVDLVNRNLGTMIVLLIAGYVANTIGSLLCGIGLLVSIPVVIIANTYAYRRMQGQAVAA